VEIFRVVFPKAGGRRALRVLSTIVQSQESFAGILAAAKTGAEWAITALYREHQGSLLRYLRAQAGAEGEDLASEVWLQAAAGLGRFDGDDAAFRHWLFTIAHRRLIDARRRQARRNAIVHSLAESPAQGQESNDPEKSALRVSDSEEALARIATLPPDQAEIVLLRVIGGLDVEEVASIVGKKPGTVRVLQHRALKRLERELAGEGRTVDVTE
jgi:RNA polymerase sigma-70 factor, ECF subfamily